MVIISFCLTLVLGVLVFMCFYCKFLPHFVSQDLAFWLTPGFFSFGAFLVSLNKLVRFFGYYLDTIRFEEKKNREKELNP